MPPPWVDAGIEARARTRSIGPAAFARGRARWAGSTRQRPAWHIEHLPDEVARLCWDVDLDSLDLTRDADYVMGRVMARGGWAAMCWLRATYPKALLADFLRRKGDALPPRERAYGSLISDAGLPALPGGGRPSSAG